MLYLFVHIGCCSRHGDMPSNSLGVYSQEEVKGQSLQTWERWARRAGSDKQKRP